MNDVSSAILDMDRVSSFTCLFDGFISCDFRIVVILIFLDSEAYALQPTSARANSDDIELYLMSWISVAYLFVLNVC